MEQGGERREQRDNRNARFYRMLQCFVFVSPVWMHGEAAASRVVQMLVKGPPIKRYDGGSGGPA